MSPVVINEFELVAAPPATGPGGEPTLAEAQQADNPPVYSPVLEIEQVMHHYHERLLRVWAH